MTFSIIVPVYNVEKYLSKCLDSLLVQTFSDFEIIVVNDGSPDNSQVIIDRYAVQYPAKIKAFIKENGGLSDARNFGIQHATGEYLLFVDSDDYVHPDMLAKLWEEICNNHPDVIGFHYSSVKNNVPVETVRCPVFSNLSGEEAVITFVNAAHSFHTAWAYAYRTQYWSQSGFSFMRGIYSEDFALTPLVLLRANSVSCIDFVAYNYVLSEGSIMRTRTPQQIRKLAQDLLTAYDHLIAAIEKEPAKNPAAQELLLAYLANNVVYRMDSIEGGLKQWYRKELIKRNAAGHLISNTWKRKVRKLLLRLKYRI